MAEHTAATIRSIQDEADLVQQLIFVNIAGYDTAWANFTVPKIMVMDGYCMLWNSSTDVV
jgi:hypothetical protein